MAGKPQTLVVPGVGDRIAALLRRHESVNTAVALGAAAKLSRQTLHRAINEDALTRETGRAIAGVLGVPVDSLFLAEEARPTAARGDSSLSHKLRRMVHDFEGEAHRTGATIEDMDYLRLSLSDESIRRLLGDAAIDRPLSADEQIAELEIRLDELRAWLKRRIEIRQRGRR